MALDVLMELCGGVRARVSRVELSGVKARGLMGAGAVKLSASSMSKGVSLGVRWGVQRSAHTHKYKHKCKCSNTGLRAEGRGKQEARGKQGAGEPCVARRKASPEVEPSTHPLPIHRSILSRRVSREEVRGVVLPGGVPNGCWPLGAGSEGGLPLGAGS